MGKTFGEFFHQRRIATGLTLRQFCLRHGLDPGNVSKLERGVLPAPDNRKRLERYAHYLGLTAGTEDWWEFFDRASADRGKIPEEFMEDEEFVKRLPVLFRTLRNDQVEGGVLPDVVDIVRKTHSAE